MEPYNMSESSNNSDASNSENWCFRSETARLLALNVAQIHTGLNEGDTSINTLTSSFQQLANLCSDIQSMDTSKSENMERTVEIANNMSGQVTNAIMAFQFYDRLCQRLDHVQSNLQMLSGLITDEEHINNTLGWQELRDKIKSSYTMETEKKMHDAVMNGATIEEALEMFKAELNNEEDEDDIELF